MRGIDYIHFFKPLLRRCGLCLLMIFLISSLFSAYPFQFLRSPAEVMLKLTEFLERSNLLLVALLMIVLSLADHARPPSDPSRRQIPFRLGDRILLRARPLVGLAALLYFVMIPYSLLQAQVLNSMGVRILGKQAENVTEQLKAVKQELETNRLDSTTLPALKQRYSWINSPEIKSIPDLKARIESGLKKAEAHYLEQRSSGSKQVYGYALRICLIAAMQTIFIFHIWYFWPRKARLQMLDGKELDNLGVE